MSTLLLVLGALLLAGAMAAFAGGKKTPGALALLSALVCAAVWFAMRPPSAPEANPVDHAAVDIQAGELAPPDPDPVPEPASDRPGPRVFGGQGMPAEPVLESGLRQGEEEAITPKRTNFRLFGDARVRASYVGRELQGLTVEEIAPGSFWHDLGVRDGELVVAWNGRNVETPADTVALMNDMQKNPEIELVVRDSKGRERTLRHRE